MMASKVRDEAQRLGLRISVRAWGGQWVVRCTARGHSVLVEGHDVGALVAQAVGSWATLFGEEKCNG